MPILEFLFFVYLAVGAASFAWLGQLASGRQSLWEFACVFVGSWLLAALLLFAGMWAFTPEEPAVYLPTAAATHIVPMLVIAAVTTLVGRRWSHEGRVFLALSLSACFAFFAVIFLLIATCVVQSNCL